ncbi:MAG TPA: HEPN domain-containing protein, partial [Steroidobacteraceae bacterium]|nr:HEPN domain-containing protein [Steroidobacteraceae bacterium]
MSSTIQPTNPEASRLDEYIRQRGDVAHRSRGIALGPPQPHPVTREALEKAIRFLKRLVQTTEAALDGNTG